MQKVLSAKALTFASVAAFLFIIACSKSNNVDPSTDDSNKAQASALLASDAQADAVFNDVQANILGANAEAGFGHGGVFGRHAVDNGKEFGEDSIPSCVNVTVTPSTIGVFPKTVTIDFGSGCTFNDGHTRKGKMITVYTGRMIFQGSKATTTFENFYFDSIKVEGVHTLQNNSTDNKLKFTATVTNGKLSVPSGNFVEWSGNRTWEQSEGTATPYNFLDDSYSITGSTQGSLHKDGVVSTWSTNIIDPLIRNLVCRYIIKGQTKISWNNLTAILDFGTGTCDDQAEVNYNGIKFTITLH